MPRWKLVVALASALLLLAAACGGDDDEGAGDTTTTADETTTTSEATTTTAPTTGTPDEVVAVDAQGRLVVLDARSGEERRVLDDGIAVDDPADSHVAVTPDGTTAYYVRPAAETGAESRLVRISTDGEGRAEVLGTGTAPSVSPDGSLLTYVDFEIGDPLPVPVIVIRDLATDDERVLARQDEPPFQFIADTEWTLDGESVAFVAGEIFTGAYVVPAESEDLDAARRLGPDARGDEVSWLDVAPWDDDRLAVAERCCDVGPEVERWLVLAVHIETGEVEGGLLDAERLDASRLDADAGADELLIVSDLRPGGGTLLRTEGTATVEVASGIMAAAW